MAVAATSAPRAPRLSRADVVNLAHAEPWSFVQFAFPAIVQGQAADAELQILCIRALAGLDMPGAARLLWSRLPSLSRHPQGATIAGLVDRPATDELSSASRLELARANIAAVRARANAAVGGLARTVLPDERTCEDAMSAWGETITQRLVFRSPRGHVIETSAAQPAPPGSTRFFTPVPESKVGSAGAPSSSTLYIAGIQSASALEHAIASRPPGSLGMLDRFVVIEPDLLRFVDAMSTADLRGLLEQLNIDLLIGPGALDSFTRLLNDRLGIAIVGQVTGVPSLAVEIGAIVNEAVGRQTDEVERLAGAIEIRDQTRSLQFIRERWLAGDSGSKPLKFLLTTTRFSSFVKHSTHDIAAALRRAGHIAEVLIEPDDASRIINLELYRRALELDPDLVLCINYHRRAVLGPVMSRVPYVCFIQDRMSHLFTPEAGRSIGPLDFTVGHLHPELFDRFSYPRRNTLMFPVPADAQKFSVAEIDPALLTRHACEIAYVSHQSQPVDQLLRTLSATLEPRPRAVVGRLLDLIVSAIADAPNRLDIDGVATLCRDALCAQHSGEPSPEEVAALASIAGLPIAERLLRHRMLAWAAELCGERGWRLGLYGQGWEKHPTLAHFARGPLAHDDNLVACYRAARVHLHTGMGGVHHQRVMECALAGGCTLVEIKAHDLRLLDWCTRNAIAAELRQTNTPADSPVAIADHWQAMMLCSLSDRLGLDNSQDREEMIAIEAGARREPWGEGRCVATTFQGSWMLGDLEHASFWSRELFRRNASAVIESPARRESLASWQRRAVLQSFTHDAFVQRLIETVRCSLATGGA